MRSFLLKIFMKAIDIDVKLYILEKSCIIWKENSVV